jgi:hypothetical protein
MQGSEKTTKEAAKADSAAVLAGGAPLRRSVGFLEMYDRLQPNATAWAVVRPRERGFKLAQYASAFGGDPAAAFGTLRVADGFDATVRFRMDTADLASQATTTIQKQVGAAAALFGTFAIPADGLDVVITLAMTAEQIRGVASMAKSMLGSASTP